MTDEPLDPVLYDVTDGVATITLNRPDAMNGLDIATKKALLDAVRLPPRYARCYPRELSGGQPGRPRPQGPAVRHGRPRRRQRATHGGRAASVRPGRASSCTAATRTRRPSWNAGA